MDIKEKVLVPEHYKDKIVKTVCDFCTKELNHRDTTEDGRTFYGSLYFNLSTEKEDNVINFDVCATCAVERLVPLLKGEAISGIDWVKESNE